MDTDKLAHHVVCPFIWKAFLLKASQLVAHLLKSNGTVPIQFFFKEICIDATNFLDDITEKLRPFQQFSSVYIRSNNFYCNRPQHGEIVTGQEQIDCTAVTNIMAASIKEIS